MIRPPDDLFDDLPFLRAGPSARQREAAESVAALTDRKLERLEGPKKNFQLAPRTIAKAKTEMDEMSDAGAWDAAKGVHLVALYSWLHVAVYGIEPAELDGKAWAQASVTAQRFVVSYFGGSFPDCVEFMRWTWKREAKFEEYRRAEKTGGKRIGWRLQFSPSLVTDFRIDQARRS